MSTDSEALLRALVAAEVEFIVIGGAAAIAQGAATPTRDLDIAAPLTAENLRRLMTALKPLHPRHATRPELGEVWQSPAELTRFRLLLLQTDAGRLDVLPHVEPLGDYAALEAIELELLEGHRSACSPSTNSSPSSPISRDPRTRSSRRSCGRSPTFRPTTRTRSAAISKNDARVGLDLR